MDASTLQSLLDEITNDMLMKHLRQINESYVNVIGEDYED
jgi:hypothetical protein